MWWSSLHGAARLLPSCGVVWPRHCVVLRGCCLHAALRGSRLRTVLCGGCVCSVAWWLSSRGVGCPSSSCGVEWRLVRCGVADVFTRCCMAVVFARRYAAVVFTRRCAAVVFAASRGGRLRVALRCGVFALPGDCHRAAVVFASPLGLLLVCCRLRRGHHRCRRSKGRGHLPSRALQTGRGLPAQRPFVPKWEGHAPA
jgi:hypothetical protein